MTTAVKEMNKKATKAPAVPPKGETKVAKQEPKKEKAPEINYITTRNIADELGVKPATLRRYLRTLPKFQDSGYTRYKWDPNSKEDMQNVSDIKSSFKKHAEKEAEGKETKKADKAKAKAAAPAPAEDEDADLADDDESGIEEEGEDEEEESL